MKVLQYNLNVVAAFEELEPTDRAGNLGRTRRARCKHCWVTKKKVSNQSLIWHLLPSANCLPMSVQAVWTTVACFLCDTPLCVDVCFRRFHSLSNSLT